VKNSLLLTTIILLLTASLACAQSGTGGTTVSVSVGAEAALTITDASTSLTSTGSNFSNYTGTTNLTYFIRTTASGGSGSIKLEVTTDFACGGAAPCVATPPSPGDTLSYTCAASPPGNSGTATPCSGSVTASTSSQTSVVTFGADARSLKAGNSASVTWTLTNDPIYKVGSYNATVTFYISAA
jgi:hypothetical protein